MNNFFTLNASCLLYRRTSFEPPLFRALREAGGSFVGLRAGAARAAGTDSLTRLSLLPLHPNCGEQTGRVFASGRGYPLRQLRAGLLKGLQLLVHRLPLLHLLDDLLLALELHHIEHS